MVLIITYTMYTAEVKIYTDVHEPFQFLPVSHCGPCMLSIREMVMVKRTLDPAPDT